VKEDRIGEDGLASDRGFGQGHSKAEHKLDDPDGFLASADCLGRTNMAFSTRLHAIFKGRDNLAFWPERHIGKSGNKLTITLSGTVDAADRGGQAAQKKSAATSFRNSGPIETVTVDGTLVYDTEADQPGS